MIGDDVGATSIDATAVDRVRDLVIEPGTKGMPLHVAGMTVGALAELRWHVFRDGLPMPLMVLKDSALTMNVAAMAAYCRSHGVLLCPHGKTTMSPQLFRRQIDAGAWGLTAATPSHLRMYRRFGVQRVIYANELVEPAPIAWLADELERDPAFELICLVDSAEAVEFLDKGLAGRGSIGVLIEVGYAGGRCGVRDRDAARRVASAVDAARSLTLLGLECFEGLAGDGTHTDDVDELLLFVRSIAHALLETTSLAERGTMLVSAGGSAYFDRVVETFVERWNQATPVVVVLRSGCYITHDGGFYQRTSPLAGRRDGEPVLRDAIEIWSAVLSRPESARAICSMGRRDAPEDLGLPVPTRIAVRGGDPAPLRGVAVTSLNDQHAHLDLPPECELRPGDLVGCSISHPCSAFDRWKVIPVVDDGYTIRDAVVTFF